jgi:DNA polymerase-1
MNPDKKLFLLDAMALIYRSYFAFQRNPRINSKGFNTGAVLGFTNTLWDILKNQKPSHIGVAFDTMVTTFRQEEFSDYKANREKMPEELALAIPYIKKVIEGFNIPILFKDGYEADDVIGTLAKKAEKEGFTVFMMTPDKDFAQLVSDNIFMYKPARMGNEAQIWGVKEVLEKFQIKDPKQVIDILGLWGDASDNIPGIPGIGEKRAKELIGRYGSVEGVIEHVDELKGKMAENVRNFAQQGLDSKRLATIDLNVPIEFDEKTLRYTAPNEKLLKEVFDEMEFRTLAKRIFTDLSLQPSTAAGTKESSAQTSLFDPPAQEETRANLSTVNHEYRLIETPEEIKKLAAELSRLPAFCFDTETTAIDAHVAELVGIAFSWEKHKGVFVYLPENYGDAMEMLEPLKDVFTDENIGKTGQNLKYDLSVLRWYDIEVKGKLFDTMIAHYLLEPDMKHGMDFLSVKYLGYEPEPIENLIGKKGKNQRTMRTVEKEKLKEYACEDADITWQLQDVFSPMLEESGVKGLFEKVEMPLVRVLTAMETEGVNLDVDALLKFSEDLAGEIAEVEEQIYLLAGHKFNIASPKQLGVVLFEELKIVDKPKMTKTKQYKTGEEILVKLTKKHPIVGKILEYRGLTKLKSTYVDALPKLVNPRTKRIHTSYNQAVASTGRLSSNNPNLQNIPIRTPRGREIRKSFIPRNKKYKLFAADYSQIELRLMAHFSGDINMINDFEHGKDIHRATAARVYGVAESDVTKEMRSHAKSVNFGIIYGISAFGLAENLGISRSEAARIINQYFAEYPMVKEFMDKQIAFAREHGYVETILGRRRYLRDINSANAVVRGFAERNAVNAPIQGSSADMIKVAMIDIFQELNNRNMDSKMILQVHDELVFDMPAGELDDLRELVTDKMMNAIKLDVPVVVDWNTGDNWLEAH